MSQFIQLQSPSTSLVIQLQPAPQVLHWGRALAPLTSAQFTELAKSQHRAVPQGRLDCDVPLTLCPELGRGSFGASGIEGHRRGLASMPRFDYVSHQQFDNRVTIECQDIRAELALTFYLELDPNGVLNHQVTLCNLGQQPYTLNKLALTLPLPYRANQIESYHGRWSREFQAQRQRLNHGAWVVENRRGRTSHEYFPGCLVGIDGFSEQQGEVWSFHLGWSGNHQWRAEAKSDGRRFVQAGEWLLPGEIELGNGERYTSPELFSSYSKGGINGLRRNHHRYVRQQILPFSSDKPRPVHLNTWEGIYFDHDPEYICQMATQAAAIGVERFIVDDGWFKGRISDKSSLGDWELDKRKYPHGLAPVISHVSQLGMEFGLWVEPEMVNPDSDLFRAHPEWLLAAEGYHPPTGRNQYVLNLQDRACFDYLFTRLDALLREHNIAYLKWDMNRELVQATHEGRGAVHGQTKALYRLIDKLTAAHSGIEIESCSSGGGRVDYEILKRTCRFWASDCNDALERQTIQKHMGIFFPPEVIGTHIGPYHGHTTRRTHDISLRGLTALNGHMGVELDPVKESELEKQAFAKYVALHKRYRSVLHSGDSFYLDSSDETRLAYGVFDQTLMLLTVCQLVMPEYALPEPLYFDYLEPHQDYQVCLLDFPSSSEQLMKLGEGWWQDGELTVKGEWLMTTGLALPLLDPEACMLLSIEPSS